MKLAKIIASTIAIICVTMTVAFAVPDKLSENTMTPKQEDNVNKKEKTPFGWKKIKGRPDRETEERDPIKALESQKERIQLLLKDGKINKEKADELTKKIDLKIEKVKEFNGLGPMQKKEKLLAEFNKFIEKQVKDGRLTREKADKMVKDFTEKINNWDGQGYPDFFRKGFSKKIYRNKGM